MVNEIKGHLLETIIPFWKAMRMTNSADIMATWIMI